MSSTPDLIIAAVVPGDLANVKSSYGEASQDDIASPSKKPNQIDVEAFSCISRNDI